MALEGSHIRFALDTKDKIRAKNLDKYISGSIYPDSRYFTRTARELTHDNKYLEKDFYSNDDFKKGWVIHLLTDKFQSDVFGEILQDQAKVMKWGDESWICRTALKVLQDLSDIKKFNLVNYLKHLNYVETPNNESVEEMKRYNQIFVDLYKKDNITFDDLYMMWVDFGVGESLAQAVKDKALHYREDNKMMLAVEGLYNDVLTRLNSYFT